MRRNAGEPEDALSTHRAHTRYLSTTYLSPAYHLSPIRLHAIEHFLQCLHSEPISATSTS